MNSISFFRCGNRVNQSGLFGLVRECLLLPVTLMLTTTLLPLKMLITFTTLLFGCNVYLYLHSLEATAFGRISPQSKYN